MRLVLLSVLLAGAAAPAFAADPPAPAAAPEPPICTTVTTVVKRGDVVLSTNSTTKCEDPAHPGGGINPGAMLQAPAAVFTAPAQVLDAIGAGNGDQLTAHNAARDRRVVNSRTGDVCHLTLSVRTSAAGFVAREAGCRDEIARASAWTYREGAAEVLGSDGGVIVRLTGTRDLLKGATGGGDALTLQR
jgi:hypothetical protein